MCTPFEEHSSSSHLLREHATIDAANEMHSIAAVGYRINTRQDEQSTNRVSVISYTPLAFSLLSWLRTVHTHVNKKIGAAPAAAGACHTFSHVHRVGASTQYTHLTHSTLLTHLICQTRADETLLEPRRANHTHQPYCSLPLQAQQ